MTTKKLEIPESGVVVVTKHDHVHLQALTGFVFGVVVKRLGFYGAIHKKPEQAAHIAVSFQEQIEKWKQEFGFSDREVEIKFLAPRGLESVVELVTKSYKSSTNGKYFARGDAVEFVFEGDTGRFRIAGVSHEQKPKSSSSRSRNSRVLIVDDSKTMRKLLEKMVSSIKGFEVVGLAEKPSEVEALIEKVKPDVMTLDLNMPEMSGVELLKEIFPKYNIPTLIVSSVNAAESTKVIEALEIGAIDYVHKTGLAEIDQMQSELENKLLIAADESLRDRIRDRQKTRLARSEASKSEIVGLAARSEPDLTKLIAIGASTGGTEAILDVLRCLPVNVPPIVITQHIPAFFSAAFASSLNAATNFSVREAKDGDVVLPGEVVVGAGDKQLEVVGRENGGVKVRVADGPKVSGHRPSVDVLFASVAKTYGKKAVAVLMTGMGKDGAESLLKLKQTGAHTIIQDEESCVVYGMPKSAEKIGAHCEICSLDNIAMQILKNCQKNSMERKAS